MVSRNTFAKLLGAVYLASLEGRSPEDIAAANNLLRQMADSTKPDEAELLHAIANWADDPNGPPDDDGDDLPANVIRFPRRPKP